MSIFVFVFVFILVFMFVFVFVFVFVSREICQDDELRAGVGAEEALTNGEDSWRRPPDTNSLFLYLDELRDDQWHWWWAGSRDTISPYQWVAMYY